MRTFLVDACADGAEIVTADVRRIDVENGSVVGVTARAAGGELRVRAAQVALAGGAILSPALLLRSGIAPHQAGRGFHLHPVAVTSGVYESDLGGTWSGVPQSVLVDEFAEIDGAYGFRLEVPQAYPGILAASFPWWGAGAHRSRSVEARRIAPFIGIVRDRTEGRVVIDTQGEPVVRYTNGDLERRLLERAMVEFLAPAVDELVAEIARRGVATNRVALFSAHQMSSCRIGTARAASVADPEGQVWGVRGLFVTDASAFPSAAGVNPMMTVMALARRTGQTTFDCGASFRDPGPGRRFELCGRTPRRRYGKAGAPAGTERNRSQKRFVARLLSGHDRTAGRKIAGR